MFRKASSKVTLAGVVCGANSGSSSSGVARRSFLTTSIVRNNNNPNNTNNNSDADANGKESSSAGPSPSTASGAGMNFASSGAATSSTTTTTTLTGRGAPTLTRVMLKKTGSAAAVTATTTSHTSPSKGDSSSSFSASSVAEGTQTVKAQSAAAAASASASRVGVDIPKFSTTDDAAKVSGASRAYDDAFDVRDLTAHGVPESAAGAARALAASGERVDVAREKEGGGEGEGSSSSSDKSSIVKNTGPVNPDSYSSLVGVRRPLAEDEVIPSLGSELYGTLQGGTKIDHGPLRPTGMWQVSEVVDEQQKTVDFRRIDEVESEIMETLEDRDSALVLVDDEEKWKHKLMFQHKFKKTPKHLTWKEMGQEIECLDCVIDLDPHRPEERFTMKFQFLDKRKGVRDVIWEAKNDVSYSEGFTDLMAAIGSCLGRADVFRTIRFDDGKGTTRELTIQKKSRFTSDIQLSFRPAVSYNLYERKENQDNWEKEVTSEGLSPWGFHPQLMDPEYRDVEDPEGTYTLSLSAHSFSFIMLRCIDRLITKPLKEFYRPSQVAKRAKTQKAEEIGLSHAMKGWLGLDEQIYPHYTPIEALQEHWLGPDAPFTFVAIVNKLREMTYLKKKNPEFSSWLAVRQHDTAFAIRNLSVKMLGAGASTLFVPRTHNTTANFLLPKTEHRRLESKFSLNAALGMPDETKNIAEFKKLTGNHKIEDGKDKKDSKESADTTTEQKK